MKVREEVAKGGAGEDDGRPAMVLLRHKVVTTVQKEITTSQGTIERATITTAA
jgi:hypothetical protein